jgi:succinoglycan biosynthesis transport protein ExoP
MAEERTELDKMIPLEEVPLERPRYPSNAGYPESTSYGYGHGEAEESDGLNVREIWRMIRKRQWLILAIVLIVTSLVTIEAYRTKSTFTASAFIEIGKDSPAIRSGPNDRVIQTEDSDTYYPQLSINTNLFRLTSEPLLEDVVVNLKLDENPSFMDLGKKSVVEAIELIRNRFIPQAQDEPPPPPVYIPVTDTHSNAPRSVEESARLAPYVGIISGGLRAEPVKDTRTLKVTYTHTNPAITAAVANGVARAFIDETFDNKTERFTKASAWLDKTTRELKARVERADQTLADYTRTHNIFSTDGKETLTTDKLSKLHELVTRAETERMLKQSLYEEIKAGRGGQLPAAYADLKLTALQTRLEELQGSYDKLALKFGPDNPAMIEAQQQIAVVQKQIDTSRHALEEKLKSEYEVAVRDEQSLKNALAQSKGEAVQQNQDAIQYNILKQEVETAKGLYTDFLNKTSQAQVEVAQQHNNLRLIQPARIPGSPIGPARFRMIMFAFFLSLAGGIGLAYGLEYLDNTIKTIDDVGRYMRLPALGLIPALASTNSAKLGKGKKARKLSGSSSLQAVAIQGYDMDRLKVLETRSTAAEAYRVVRTSMLLSTAGNPPKTILVTSGQPGEGKTTTAVNTAISLAQLGASVLIIDCDMRKPSTHKIFGLDNMRGLSTYLSRNIEVDGLIRKLQIPNLSLLSSGAIPPNPAELISSERMKNLLRELGEKYDHILIDSPPLINVTDPIILSSMVDGVILVVHGGRSTRGVAQRARQDLVSVGAKIFGVVLNNVDMRREGYNEYYYYRYYSDYGQKDEREEGAAD